MMYYFGNIKKNIFLINVHKMKWRVIINLMTKES